jgi:hypothetical protein
MARSLVRMTVMSPEMNYLLGMLGLGSIHSGRDIVAFRATKQHPSRDALIRRRNISSREHGRSVKAI